MSLRGLIRILAIGAAHLPGMALVFCGPIVIGGRVLRRLGLCDPANNKPIG